MFGCRDALLHYRSQTRKIAGPQYHWIEPQAREDSGLQKTALIRSNLAIFAVDQFAPDELLPPGSHRQILPPYRNGREVEIENGLPLGIIAECECIETSLILEPGERLTFVSDGVVEAANEKSELYGFDRTREISEQPAREIADAAKAWGQNDDITVVRRCEKIKSRRRNRLRHQCKSIVPNGGAGGFACPGPFADLFFTPSDSAEERMTRSIFVGLLLAAAACAQSVDLSGEWRKSPDDRPAYAQPDLDDHAWEKVYLPWTAAPPAGGIYWLRRSVGLPPSLDSSRLAITLGPVAEVYELHVNGVPIAGIGSFTDARVSQLSRSQTFAIPSAALGGSRQMQIAIRLGPRFLSGIGLSVFVGGSYVVTNQDNVPRGENIQLMNQHKVTYATKFVSAVLLLSFAFLFCLLWLSEKDRTELLWLGLLVSTRGLFDGWTYLSISLNSFPRSPPDWPSLSYTLSGAALSEMIMAVTGIKSNWLRSFFWISWSGYFFLGDRAKVGGLIDCAALAVLFFGWWQNARHRDGWVEHLTMITMTLVTLTHLNLRLIVIPTTVVLGGSAWSLTSYSIAFFSAILALLTLRRLMSDRREKQRLAGELEAARTVQQLLLPRSQVSSPAYEVKAVYQPAEEVGGDFHWNRVASDGSVIVVVGDVSGKGLKAAMLVSVAVGILRNEKSTSPAAVLGALNEGLTGRTGGGFVTCCCARFATDGAVTLANAGHPAPYCDGHEVEMEAGLPLGIAPELMYQESVARGERFTFVSDGVVEAANARGELFGFERTREISGKPAQEIAEAAKAWGQNDDITVVTVLCKPEGRNG